MLPMTSVATWIFPTKYFVERKAVPVRLRRAPRSTRETATGNPRGSEITPLQVVQVQAGVHKGVLNRAP